MKNNAKKFPLPTGEQWARLPERVLALETAPKPKIFRATIFQDGTNDPTITEVIDNTTGATFTFTRTGVGNYRIESSIPLFISRGKVIVTLSAAKFAITPAYNYGNQTRITLFTFNATGVQSDSLLVENMITIEILD
jgi:hypothetical protein